MDISDKNIAVLVDNYFEQAEFEEPIKALRDAGAEVTVITIGEKELTGMNHIEKGDSFQADLKLKNASSDDYDALVLPGGAINADSLRLNNEAQLWVDDFLNSDRPIAAICHAQWLLVSADAVHGRHLTSYHTIQDDILNAGGDWVDRSVVVDGNLITSRQPDDLPEFNEALINMLGRRAPVAPDENELKNQLAYSRHSTTSGRDIESSYRLRSLGY
jgi:protease I